MVNHLAEFARINFLAQLAQARNPDGSYDLLKVKDAAKKIYRATALLIHPDRNPDNKYAEELFKQLGTATGDLEKANGSLVEYLKQSEQPEFGGAGQELQALVAQAVDAVENLTSQKQDLEQRLARTQADIVSLRRGGQYRPDQLEIYVDQQRGIRITFANANQEIGKLVQNGALSEHTLLYENKAHSLRITPANAKPEIERLVQKLSHARAQEKNQRDLAQQYLQQRDTYMQNAQQAQKDLQQQKEKAEKELQQQLAMQQQESNGRYSRLVARLNQETEQREAAQQEVQRLDQLLYTTQHAATSLITRTIDEQKQRYDIRITDLETAISSTQDPIESLLANQTSDDNPFSLYLLAQYLLTKESQKTNKDESKIEYAKWTLFKALESRQETITTAVISLGIALAQIEQYDLGIATLQEVTKQQPENITALAHLTKYLFVDASKTNSIDWNKIDQAREYIPLISRSQEKETNIIYQLGEKMLAEGKYSVAEVIFYKIKEGNPKNLAAWNKLANAIHLSNTTAQPDREEYAKYCIYRAQGNE